MMKKNMMTLAMVAFLALSASADSYTTAGNGTQWTLERLAAEPAAGITQQADTFKMSNTIVIAKGDRFDLTAGVVVMMAEGVSFEFDGTARLAAPADRRVLFTRLAEGVVPGVVYVKNDEQVTAVKNIDFEYAGLKNFGAKGLDVDSCTFFYHAASSNNGSSALNIGGTGAEFTVRNCIFVQNERSGISGAANSPNPLLMENCQFLYNGTNNRPYPQVNLTAASQVTIRNCFVLGDRSKMRVGGIVVSNMLSSAQNAHLLVEDCFVMDASYGISVYSDQTAVVRNNVLINNNVIADANMGGSGLNVTDSDNKQVTKFTGNFVMGCMWGATVIGGKNINFGRVDVPEDSDDYNPGGNVFYNNGNGGVVYDLYNNSSNIVYAQHNAWLTAATFKSEGIASCIFDKSDNASLGEVCLLASETADPAGIAQMTRALQGVQAVYNMNGMRTDALRKGLNIVVKDGKVVKVAK